MEDNNTSSYSHCQKSSDNNVSSESEIVTISTEEESERIVELNEMINEENLSWTAGHTSISNLTVTDVNRRLGATPPNEAEEIQELALSDISAEALPSSFTWQSNCGDWTTPVHNQGSCGLYWAFAGTAVFESYWERYYLNPSLNPNFAEHYLVSCDFQDSGCSGGWVPFNYFISTTGSSGGVGTVNETDYPCIAHDSSCTRYKDASGTAWYYVKNSYSVPSVDQLKTAIFTYDPICVDSSFSAYSGGIYSSSYSGSINHAVEMVGWNTNNGNTYWICKNSWGTGWGESGWFRIYAGSNYIGYATAYMINPLTISLTVTDITPSSVKRGSVFQITNHSGSYFLSGLMVNLTRIGYSKVTASNLNATSSSLVTSTLNLAEEPSGIWNVSVKNSNDMIGSLTQGFTVLPNISAKFFGIPGTTIRPLVVNLYNASEDSPTSWAWNFGDRTSNVTTKNAIHTYSTTENYTVKLIIGDS